MTLLRDRRDEVNRSRTSKKAIQLSLIVAVGLVLFLFESFIPRPLPWLKPGLANIATLFTLYTFDLRCALTVTLLRILLGSLIIGSLELKKLMYMTARRIRYASSPDLAKAAVYFKSGSLYKCKPEPGFTCKKYMGNVDNYMNSVAIVEQPDGRVYLVALMSNVLKKNSAVDHQTIASQIDRILKE